MEMLTHAYLVQTLVMCNFIQNTLYNSLVVYVYIKTRQANMVLYKPVGGAGANFCIISNMLHIRDPFFKFKKYLQII